MSKVTLKTDGPNKKGEVARRLEEIGIDAICALLERDKSLAVIADELGVRKSSLIYWLDTDPVRSACVKSSMIASATACDDKAEAILMALTPDATNAEVARARELAQHYRWRAKTRNPRQYGDKSEVEVNVTARTQSLADLMDSIEARVINVTPALAEV